jgi:hypothetical protein
MANLLEIRSQKPDNGVAGHCGFGCGDFRPGSGSSRYRGPLFHDERSESARLAVQARWAKAKAAKVKV